MKFLSSTALAAAACLRPVAAQWPKPMDVLFIVAGDPYPTEKTKLAFDPGDRSKQVPFAIPNHTDFAAITDKERREFKRADQACVSFTAAQLGKVFDAMDRLKLWKNTLVVLIGYADSNAPHRLSGESLRPVMDDPKLKGEMAAYTQVNRGKAVGRSVRTSRWHYTDWGLDGKDGIELYDHSKDTGEYHNLIGNPAHSHTSKELAKLLKLGFPSTH